MLIDTRKLKKALVRESNMRMIRNASPDHTLKQIRQNMELASFMILSPIKAMEKDWIRMKRSKKV